MILNSKASGGNTSRPVRKLTKTIPTQPSGNPPNQKMLNQEFTASQTNDLFFNQISTSGFLSQAQQAASVIHALKTKFLAPYGKVGVNWVLDFIQGTDGVIYFLQVKSFEIEKGFLKPTQHLRTNKGGSLERALGVKKLTTGFTMNNNCQTNFCKMLILKSVKEDEDEMEIIQNFYQAIT